MVKQPTVSVVIPSYNEASYIDRLLEALTKQSFKDFEVIVSDAQSKDGTKEVVASFGKKLNIKLFEAPPKGPAYGRNQGDKQARGEWLLFLDADDDIEDTEFLNTLLKQSELHGWQTASTKMKVRNATAAEHFGT